MTLTRCAHRYGRLRPALSLLEVTVSVVIVSVALLSSVTLIGRATTAHRIAAERIRGATIAEALLAEITALPWEDIAEPGSIGPESGESNRTSFDDLDDYNGYSETNLRLWSGDRIEQSAGWSCEVTVEAMSTASDLEDTISEVTSLLKGTPAAVTMRGISVADADEKIIKVCVTNPRGEEFVAAAIRARKGAGDAVLPGDRATAEAIAILVRPRSGDPETLVAGPLLARPAEVTP